MKKILTIIMAAAMTLSMAACGGSPAASSSASSGSAPAESASTPAESASAPAESGSAPAEGEASGQIKTADDLKGKKIGVQNGTTGEIYVQENLPDAKCSGFKSGIDAALDLKNGALDAVIIDELPAKSIVAQNPDLYILDLDLATESYAIAVKKGNTELLDSINATIKAMQEDGSYEALVNAFMPAEGEDAIKIPEKIVTEGEKTMKMGTNAAFKPFEYAEGTDVVGFDVTMSERIAKDFGAKLTVENMEFDSLISALDAGAIDFIAAGMTATDERRQSVDFSEPYYSSKQVVILKK